MLLLEKTITTLLFILLQLPLPSSSTASIFNIIDFGAKPDGKTDTSGPLANAWAKACGSADPSSIYIPNGTFYVSSVIFRGPCNNKGITVYNKGTLIAPLDYNSKFSWIGFMYVDGISINGGLFDGRGQRFWNCKAARRNCPNGATSLAFSICKNVRVSAVTLQNSELFHMLIFGSNNVKVEGSNIEAPYDSPNTDGIHVEKSDRVNITSTFIGTGDDCISIGPGSTNVLVKHVHCGPGHGISIGSLAETKHEAGVQNITVRNVGFDTTMNGFRIKTWARPSDGFVYGVNFKHSVMKNVDNPVIIDQTYCPYDKCPKQSSGIKISGVSYENITGTSATPIAINFDCSSTHPCTDIRLRNIRLTYGKKYEARATCKNVEGQTSGFVVPRPTCFGR